jgi:hypothetical protein
MSIHKVPTAHRSPLRGVSVSSSLPLFLAAGLVAVFSTGCSDTLTDDEFGGVDLQPFFFDTASGLVPSHYTPREGYHDAVVSTFYSFGTVAVQQRIASPKQQEEYGIGEITTPATAYLNPMYFFFDSDGNPMFSVPVREMKTGQFTLRGGEGLRNPNPDPKADRTIAYPLRKRNFLVDPNRRVADYQRPIIDTMIEDARTTPYSQWRYSGLWEIIKVKAPSGYKPDSIKSWKTLLHGIDSGDFEIDGTEMGIDCPLIDSRSLVVPTVTVYKKGEVRVPQPLIEVWYRKKLIDCFMVHGWESIGRTDMSKDMDGNDKFVLYKWNQDPSRVATFDVDAKITGTGESERREIVAPVGRIFAPTIQGREATPGQSPKDLVLFDRLTVTMGAMPRRSQSDPPGYRPLRWLWAIDVLNLTEVNLNFDKRWFANENKSTVPMTNIADVDRSKLRPLTFPITRLGTTKDESIVLNYPISGQKVTTCEEMIKADKEGNPLPEAMDPCRITGQVCPLYQKSLHSSDYCETKKVVQGEYCADTVAECYSRVDISRTEAHLSQAEIDAITAKTKEMPPKPLTLDDGEKLRWRRPIYRGDMVEEWFFQGVSPAPDCGTADDLAQTAGIIKGDDLKNKYCFKDPVLLLDELKNRVPEDWRSERTFKSFIAVPDGGGVNSETYGCLKDERGLGHCYVRCNGADSNSLQGQLSELEIELDNGTTKKFPAYLDSRCGGERAKGIRCLPISNDQELNEKGGRFCLRECDQETPIKEADALCQVDTPVFYTDRESKPGDGSKYYPSNFTGSTKCLVTDPFGSTPAFDACIRDVAFEPR